MARVIERMSAFAAVPASRKHPIVRKNTGKLLKFFILISKIFSFFNIGVL
jgi:hypothetical protein